MASVKEIYRYLDRLAPFSSQMSFDNAGFLVGRGNTEVKRLMVALDITEEVVREAAEASCQLIVAHHPVIFHPARSITDETPNGRILLALTENHLAAVCAHTNLDVARGGVNDALVERLGLADIELLQEGGVDPAGRTYGLGRVGTISGYESLPAFAAFVRDALRAPGVRFGDAGRPVRRVAVGGGACGDLLEQVAAAGCDTFVTADVKYNVFLDAGAMGVNLIDAGHFSTEDVVCPVLAGWLEKGFPAVDILLSKKHKEAFSCL